MSGNSLESGLGANESMGRQQGMRMRKILGILGLFVAIGFEIGLFYSNGEFSWDGRNEHPWAGFFGFGIPMVLLGYGVGALWFNMPDWLRGFAWICTLSGILWAGGLFITVGRWVGLVSPGVQSSVFWVGVGSFFAFVIPMLITGGLGIAILLDHEDKRD
jgi:hypothetical protein